MTELTSCAGEMPGFPFCSVAAVAYEFRVVNTPVSMLGLSFAHPHLALMIDGAMNGFTRPFFAGT
jgi:hypothetical protein